MKEIKTEITINASIEKVWEVLMDTYAYGKWNPFIRSIEGEVKMGETIKVQIQPPGKKPMIFNPEVLKRELQSEFRWKGKLLVKGLFDGEHYFKLIAIDESKTQFVHGEKFSGILAGMLLKSIGENTKQGFSEMNEALKKTSRVMKDRTRALRTTLKGNAAFSGISGVAMIFFSRSIAELIGLRDSWIMMAIGIGLLLFGTIVFLISRRDKLRKKEVRQIVFMDIGWVVGSAVLMISEPFKIPSSGSWTIACIALIVLFFAVFQWFGLKKAQLH